MAFYQNAPGKKKGKTPYAELGSWDEEGTHYGDRGDRKEGKKSSPARPSEKRSFSGSGRPGKGSGDRSGKSMEKSFSRPRREEAPSRSGRKPAPRSERGGADRDQGRFRGGEEPRSRRREDFAPVRESEGYRDYEFRAPAEGRALPPEEEISNILCGRNPIREALKTGRDIEKLLVQKGELSGSAREIVQSAKAARIMVQEVEKSRLDEIAPHHQGLIAFASAYAYAQVEDMLKAARQRGEEPFLILLDGVTDPHNLGAIIRSAECAGAHGVIVPQHRSVGLTPAAVKASAGAIEHIPVARVTNLNRTIEDLRKQGIWVYALAMDGEDYEKVDFRGGTALVIGAEGEGISRLTREKCDQTVALPMRGKLDSLNASVAAGIMMYRVLSCRRK